MVGYNNPQQIVSSDAAILLSKALFKRMLATRWTKSCFLYLFDLRAKNWLRQNCRNWYELVGFETMGSWEEIQFLLAAFFSYKNQIF